MVGCCCFEQSVQWCAFQREQAPWGPAPSVRSAKLRRCGDFSDVETPGSRLNFVAVSRLSLLLSEGSDEATTAGWLMAQSGWESASRSAVDADHLAAVRQGAGALDQETRLADELVGAALFGTYIEGQLFATQGT